MLFSQSLVCIIISYKTKILVTFFGASRAKMFKTNCNILPEKGKCKYLKSLHFHSIQVSGWLHLHKPPQLTVQDRICLKLFLNHKMCLHTLPGTTKTPHSPSLLFRRCIILSPVPPVQTLANPDSVGRTGSSKKRGKKIKKVA